MEIWKDIYFWQDGEIFDYRGLYQVSNYGRIKSLNYRCSGKEQIMKVLKKKKGYLFIILCKNGKQKNFRVHRLVAHMFLSDSYFEGAQVNHKDENKENNQVSNLEWCTIAYNNNYGTRNKRHSESNKNKPKGSLIARYDLNMNLIDIKYQFEYFQMGFDRQNISACCRGKRKSHKGFIFKYYEE